MGLDGHGHDLPQSTLRAWEVAMVEMGRTEILTRYRHLRAISTHHHNEALHFVPHAALVEQACRLGLTVGKMLVAESLDEVTLVYDLTLYTAPPGRSRGIERYARSASVTPGSDEDVMLQALRRARFSVWRVERPHETAGLMVQDLIRQEEVWLVDEHLEQTALPGTSLAMRLSTPAAFAMTCGVVVPVDAEMMEEVFDTMLERVHGDADAIANDRRFATTIYRIAVMDALMSLVRFASPD
jgi:hypothetical protein